MADDFPSLIPELSRWNNGTGIAVETWIGCVGSHEHAIGYATLFWPTFVERDGCVLLGRKFDEETFYGFMSQQAGDRASVEDVMNHVHLIDLFASSADPPTLAQIEWIADALRQMWSAKLARDFPDRRFEFDVRQEDPREPRDRIVTFRQAAAET